MTTVTFSSLPTEIHFHIVEYCGNNDPINLCLTSKRLNEIYLSVLYRHVDLLRFDRCVPDCGLEKEAHHLWDASKRQEQFVYTLLSHPEYGKHIRSFKGMLCLPEFDKRNHYGLDLGESTISDEELWRAMQSLTRVQNVDAGSRNGFAYCIKVKARQLPTELFHSATSVRLAGHMQYGLAKSILDAINPAYLTHLCLDMVQDYKVEQYQRDYVGGDGQIIAIGAISGLLTTLTGRCTALRTLIMRREGLRQSVGKYEAAEIASYIEWASFISSVKGTLEKFTFEYSGRPIHDMNEDHSFRNMGERFRQLVLPAIVSGNWPCLTFIQLRGMRTSDAQLGKAVLKRELKAALGENVEIVVREDVHFWHFEPSVENQVSENY